jgi:prepilin-type N-terminal cleavage/methylation domain-containing protein
VHPRAYQRPSIARRRGFTLVEVAVAIVIVGTGSVALMGLTSACTTQNRAAADTTTAAMLAQHVQEMLAELPLSDPTLGTTNFGRETGETVATSDDVDDFNGVTFAPPVDSSRAALTGLDLFSQVITVTPAAAKQLTANSGSYTGAVRVRVDIKKGSNVVHTLEWIRIES